MTVADPVPHQSDAAAKTLTPTIKKRPVVYQRLERMDRELDGHQFVAGDRFTIADITALVAIDLGARFADIKIAPEFAHLTHWYETVSSRPSAKA